MVSNIKQSSTEVREVSRLHTTKGFGLASGLFNSNTAHSSSPPRKILYISSVLEIYLISRLSFTWNPKYDKEKQGSAFFWYTQTVFKFRGRAFTRGFIAWTLHLLNAASAASNSKEWASAIFLIQCLFTDLRKPMQNLRSLNSWNATVQLNSDHEKIRTNLIPSARKNEEPFWVERWDGSRGLSQKRECHQQDPWPLRRRAHHGTVCHGAGICTYKHTCLCARTCTVFLLLWPVL